MFNLIWGSWAPSKVVAFSWTLLFYRIPTCSNLAIRNVLERTSNLNCDLGEETSIHLVLHCNVVDKVWQKVLRSLHFNIITPPTLFVHLACWSEEASHRKICKGVWLIWHASLWVIWRERNEKIHKNRVRTIDEIVKEIKVLSWHWSLSRLKIAPFLFWVELEPKKLLKERKTELILSLSPS